MHNYIRVAINLVPGLLAGLLVYSMGSYISIINPTYIDWLYAGFDSKTGHIGWQFFAKDSWHFPVLGSNKRYGDEFGSSIVYSDSIPIVAIIMKALFGNEGAKLQYIGILLMLQFVFHGAIAGLIARIFTKNALFIFAFSFLCTLSPVVFNRATENTALSMHWLLILAIYLYFKNSRCLGVAWNVLTVISLGVNFYIFAMVQLIRLASFFSQAKNTITRPLNIILKAPFSAFLIYLFALVYGYFEVSSNFRDQLSYGRGSANLMSLLHPFESGWSTILTPHAWINNQYQGFAYLGSGLMIAAALTAICIVFNPRENIYAIRRHLPIIFVCVVVFVASLGNDIYFFDERIFSWTSKEFSELHGWRRALINFLSYTRDSGRLLWILWYLIAISTLSILVRWRISSNIKIALISTLLIVQVADFHSAIPLKNLWAGVLRTFDAATYKVSESQYDKRVASSLIDVPKNFHTIIAIPGGNLVKNWDYLALLALKNDASVNAGYWARWESAKQDRVNSDLQKRLQDGALEKNMLYVVPEWYSIPESHRGSVSFKKEGDLLFLWMN
jgi:hypothetical protein